MSKRYSREIEGERERRKNQGEISASWKDGVRRRASDVRKCGEEAWEHVPPDMVEAVKQRLGIGEVIPFRDNRELERLRVVADQREGINPYKELADMVARGTVGQGREYERPVDETTQHEHTMALMMRKYAPTK